MKVWKKKRKKRTIFGLGVVFYGMKTIIFTAFSQHFFKKYLDSKLLQVLI